MASPPDTKDTKDISPLMYNYVNILTNINRARDFDCPFAQQDFTRTQDEGQQRLIYSGYLKAFDPITKSVILCNLKNKAVCQNILILGRHIVNITKSEDSINNLPTEQIQSIIQDDSTRRLKNHPFHRKEDSDLTEAQLSDRCDEIIKWLEKNRIPAERCGNDIVVAGTVRIRPPYEHVTDYICPTRTILDRLKRIIGLRPRI